VEFWSHKLTGVFDAESLPHVSRKLCEAGFKQHHWGELSNDELKDAGLKLGETKDLLKRQQSEKNIGVVRVFVYVCVCVMCMCFL